MIETENLSKRYPGGHQALKDVSISIQEGEMVFLTGHSGAGKSTLMKLIGGIEKATNGSVTINGTKLSSLNRSALPYLRRNFGFVFQDHKLLIDRSVFHNVALPLLISGFSKSEIMTRVRAALDKVGLLEKESFNRVGVTVVIATHDPAMIQGLGARIIELKQGELRA